MNDEVAILSRARRRELAEPALVLESVGIAHRVAALGGGRVALMVAAEEAPRALAELARFHTENPTRHADEPAPPPVVVTRGIGAALAFTAVIVAFHLLASTRGLGVDWIARGQLDAAAVRRGDVFRVVTALTLHADWLHVLSNAVFGAAFVAFVCQGVGTGRGLFAVLVSGALGNVGCALIRPEGHASIGASTAVFGAMGLVAALAWRRHRQSPRRRGLRAHAAWITLAILLALYGIGSERTDVLAHVNGALAGATFGVLRLEARPPLPFESPALAIASLAIIVCGWALALG